jgi:hypothetical protein
MGNIFVVSIVVVVSVAFVARPTPQPAVVVVNNWARLVLAARRRRFHRRLWSALGRYLQGVRIFVIDSTGRHYVELRRRWAALGRALRRR